MPYFGKTLVSFCGTVLVLKCAHYPQHASEIGGVVLWWEWYLRKIQFNYFGLAGAANNSAGRYSYIKKKEKEESKTDRRVIVSCRLRKVTRKKFVGTKRIPAVEKSIVV